MEGPADKYLPALRQWRDELTRAPERKHDQAYRAAWRKWYVTGRIPSEKPVFPSREERIAKSGFFTLPPQYAEHDRRRDAYLASAEGQWEIAHELLDKAARMEEKFRVLLDEPHRLHCEPLEPEFERQATRLHSYWRHLVSGYEFGGPDEILQRQADENELAETGSGMRGGELEEESPIWSEPTTTGGQGKFEGMASHDTFNLHLVRVQSVEEGLLWKAKNEGYPIAFLEYVQLCESTGQEAPNLMAYRRLQRQYRKEYQQIRKATPRRANA
jgi:hypothetical protein